MQIFNLFKRRKRIKFTVETHAFENGREVELRSDASTPCELPDFNELKFVNDHIKPYEDIMIGFATTLKGKHKIDDEIKLLECEIAAYNDLHQFCISCGQAQYFLESWVEPFRHEPEATTYISPAIDRLNYLKENYQTLKRQENIRLALLPTLDAKLLVFIDTNQPILQTDIYKAFDSAVKEDIKERLYFWDKEGRISRVKRDSTYVVSTNTSW